MFGHAVIASEHDGFDEIEAGDGPVLPLGEPGGQVLKTAETAGGFGQDCLTVTHNLGSAFAAGGQVVAGRLEGGEVGETGHDRAYLKLGWGRCIVAVFKDVVILEDVVVSDMTLVLGGARSGKSRYAEDLVQRCARPWVYVATAQAFDDEMRVRIAEHRGRRGDGWSTVEAPLALSEALDAAHERPVLVDCLTLWLTNVMLGGGEVQAEVAALEAALLRRRRPTVLVSNEVGMGIVPDVALGRAFRDDAGRLNQRVATLAEHVVFMIAGLPLVLKK